MTVTRNSNKNGASATNASSTSIAPSPAKGKKEAVAPSPAEARRDAVEFISREDVLLLLKAQEERLMSVIEARGQQLDTLGKVVDQLQTDVIKLGKELDDTKAKLDEAERKANKAVAVAAEASRDIKEIGGLAREVDVKINTAIKPVSEKVNATAKKIDAKEGEASRALKRIVQVEEARVARECAYNVLIFDCGTMERGKDSELAYAKRVAERVGASVDIKTVKTFQTKRKLGGKEVKNVTNMVITLGSQAQAADFVFRAAKEHKKRKGTSQEQAGTSQPIPNIQLDLTLPMRERLRQAKRQKGDLIEKGQYQANMIWYRVVDGIPRFYTRTGEGNGQIREWVWDQQDKCYLREQKQTGSPKQQRQEDKPGATQ
jgi:hypothetical protein